jgi:periplasmic protein TonB
VSVSSDPKTNPFHLMNNPSEDMTLRQATSPTRLIHPNNSEIDQASFDKASINHTAISQALCKALTYETSHTGNANGNNEGKPPFVLKRQPMPHQTSGVGIAATSEAQRLQDAYAVGLSQKKSTVQGLPLEKAMKWSIGLHLASPFVIAITGGLLLLLLSWLLHMNFWDWFQSKPKYQDIEFTLVPDTHAKKPDHATYLAEHNQEAGGVDKTKNKPAPKADPKAEEPEKALDKQEPSPKTATAPKPAQQQQSPQKSAPQEVVQTHPKVENLPPPTKIASKPAISTPQESKKPSPPKEVTALAAVSSTEQGTEEVPAGTLIASTTPPTPGGSLTQGPSGNPEAGPSSDPGVAVMQSLMGPYMSEIKRRLTRNWHPPRGENTQVVVLLFEIARDGTLNKVEVNTSSGDTIVDEAAIDAVKISAPFKALPEGFTAESVPILFTFDYTVYGSSSRSKRANR